MERQVERGSSRAQERSRRAAQRAARAARKAQAKLSKRRNTWGVSFGSDIPVPGVKGRGASAAISEEDQLSVLKMLQEKTITVEQAQMLLDALGK